MLDIEANATLDVSAANGFSLGPNQTLAGTGTNGSIAGNLNVNGPLALTYLAGTPTLNEINGTLMLNNDAVTVSVTGGALSAGSYKLLAKQAGGAVAGTVGNSVLTVGGGGLVAGKFGSLQISGGELYLNVQVWQAPAITGAAVTNAGTFALSFSGPNGQTYRVLAIRTCGGRCPIGWCWSVACSALAQPTSPTMPRPMDRDSIVSPHRDN